MKGGIHVVRLMGQHHAHEEDWWFLFIEAHNAFNEENHTAMLWVVIHKCPIVARFSFNCYRHWETYVTKSCKIRR